MYTLLMLFKKKPKPEVPSYPIWKMTDKGPTVVLVPLDKFLPRG